MGSVFRKMWTKPLPDGAEVFTRRRKVTTREADGTKRVEHVTEQCARWQDAKGKNRVELVTTGEDGTRRIRLESETYFAKYRDHEGTVRVVPTGCRDEANARQFLADMEKQSDRVRAGVVSPQELAVADRMADPIAQHIADYVSTLTGSADHRQHTDRYLRRLAAECRWSKLSDLRRDDFELWLASQSRPGPDGRAVRSARSRNAHHVAVVAFANWCVESKRLTVNPFAKMHKADVKLDRRAVRRSLSAAEVERIAEAARNAPRRPPRRPTGPNVLKGFRPEERLSNEDRAFLWEFLFGTGLRLNEAGGLTVGDLILDGNLPGINLPAVLVKAKDDQYIPLHADLARRLRQYVAGRGPNDPVFTLPADILRRFKGDCKRAGIPFKDERGRKVDIHALRTSFIDRLAKSGTPPKIVQELARHADISTTMEHYTDIRVRDLHAAIGGVFGPAPGSVTTSAGSRPASPLAPPLAPTVVPKSPSQSTPVHSADSDEADRQAS
jgi:integrase